jgi:hypothetical protein
MYSLQIQIDQVQVNGWLTIADYAEDQLDAAIAATNRTVMSEKSTCRVIGVEHGEVVHEQFYYQADDPDWYEHDDHYCAEGFLRNEISWQEAGF